jgi:ribosomal protein S18 acetylase RimI-like enzyme
MNELTFRVATEADVPFLLELRRRTMTEHLQRSGVEPSQSERIERVRANFACAEIVLLSGTPVGLLKVVRSQDNWDLVQIQILPEKQGGGLGSSILGKLLADADDARVSVSLSVLRANPARRLYERLGFRIVGESDKAFDMLYENKPHYWFPVKRYGWGWGLPVRWQGWIVLGLYFASIYAGVRYFRPRDSVAGFLVWLAVASIVLVAIVAWKGERPLGWRWGDSQ